MDLTAVSVGADVVAAAAVVVSLIYLAIQIRGNTRSLDRTIQATRTQNLYSIDEAFDRWRSLLLGPGDLDIWVRGLNDLNSLNREESMRFTIIASTFIWACWFMFHINHQEGLTPDINELLWQDLFKHAGFREWLIDHRRYHADAFGEFLDAVRESVGDERYEPGESSSLMPGRH